MDRTLLDCAEGMLEIVHKAAFTDKTEEPYTLNVMGFLLQQATEMALRHAHKHIGLSYKVHDGDIPVLYHFLRKCAKDIITDNSHFYLETYGTEVMSWYTTGRFPSDLELTLNDLIFHFVMVRALVIEIKEWCEKMPTGVVR